MSRLIGNINVKLSVGWIMYEYVMTRYCWKRKRWNDWYFQFNLVFEISLWSARWNKLNWDYFWWINISFMHFGIIRISLELIWGISHTLASIRHNYWKIRKYNTFVLLHFCTTTTAIYSKSVRSHHGGHKLLHGIQCNILFLKKSFFENI